MMNIRMVAIATIMMVLMIPVIPSILRWFFVFSLAHWCVPFGPTVRELIGDVLLAGNVVRTLVNDPTIVTDVNTWTIQGSLRDRALDFHLEVEIAWYLASLWHLRSKLMIAHHLLTVSVASVGYVMNVTHFSFLVLTTMIWSNVFLGAAKIAHKNKHRLAKPLFLAFAFTFGTTRVIIYPFWVLPLLFKNRTYWVEERHVGALYYGSCCCLLIVACLQYYWFGIILKMIGNT